MKKSKTTATNRRFKVGDDVTIRRRYCEWDGVDGKVTAVSDNPEDSMPYMVMRSDFYEWPFAEDELEA